MDKIKIALLDDESLIVNAIANLLSKNDNLEIVSKETNPELFIEKIRTNSNKPDILLLDLNMKPLTGLEVLDKLNDYNIQLKVIVLSSLYNPYLYGYMIKYGISAFLPKYTEPDELLNAIESVYHQSFYDKAENESLIEHYKLQKGKSSTINFSDREIEILKLICAEFSTKEIAEKVFLSPKTVEAHRAKLMEKIGCKNVVGMVTYGILNGIHVINKPVN